MFICWVKHTPAKDKQPLKFSHFARWSLLQHMIPESLLQSLVVRRSIPFSGSYLLLWCLVLSSSYVVRTNIEYRLEVGVSILPLFVCHSPGWLVPSLHERLNKNQTATTQNGFTRISYQTLVYRVYYVRSVATTGENPQPCEHSWHPQIIRWDHHGVLLIG